ncbi:type IV pilus secretin PilQ [Azovibrio restrictus]|uniref:type IV pilus secretin PilQ n=1 Tax=Azovibrio restrictus TaxID=146938 RepID=UPI0026EE58CC|nr:type IV pilus secretin PilQ [Azovibrio restrictus]MDD3482769.1 type IV pilus secretin PilQ [Azovibrio restrictus]
MMAFKKLILMATWLVGVAVLSTSAMAQEGNQIEAINIARQGGAVVVKIELKEAIVSPPAGFSIANPSRIAFDFTSVANGLGKNSQAVNEGDLTSFNIVQVGQRTRLVLNLVRSLNYSTRIDGKALFVSLTPMATAAPDGGKVTHFTSDTASKGMHGIRDISFRRGQNGEARVAVDLTDAGTAIDIKQQGKSLVVEFVKTALPDNLRRKMDVTDFATPVTSVVTDEKNGNVRMVITPKGLWEHNAYQTENQFVVEVKAIVEDPNKLIQGTKIGYQGPRISINYQNGDVRALLRLMAEELGLNAVISETVTGTTTLVLKDVPADQVIDIIFQQKGLDMRKNGNVILIAPRDELATKEKLEYESRQQLEELEPLKTETFQLNYHQAEAFKKILTDKEQRILSKRGSAVIDPRTNIIFIQDTPSRLDELRHIIAKVDIPMRQVVIEARIVEATDQFARNLGARLGIFRYGGKNHGYGGDNIDMNRLNGFVEGTATLPGLNQVNLPASTFNSVNPSEFSFILFNSAKTRFLNLEISALEADLKGRVVSSPRVMTSDQVEALIEQGVEIPYLEASSSGATSVSFKKAVLSLRVTPHITPDGKVSMQLKVNKDSRGETMAGGVAINTKKVETNVLVDNGGTVVIGGIYELTSRDDVNKVPLLGDIPFLGFAFRNTSKTNEKSELLVFITPKIVNENLSVR